VYPVIGWEKKLDTLFLINKESIRWASSETVITGDTTSNETTLNMSDVVIKVCKQKQESGSEQ
jgi:hypothetical protein